MTEREVAPLLPPAAEDDGPPAPLGEAKRCIADAEADSGGFPVPLEAAEAVGGWAAAAAATSDGGAAGAGGAALLTLTTTGAMPGAPFEPKRDSVRPLCIVMPPPAPPPLPAGDEECAAEGGGGDWWMTKPLSLEDVRRTSDESVAAGAGLAAGGEAYAPPRESGPPAITTGTPVCTTVAGRAAGAG